MLLEQITPYIAFLALLVSVLSALGGLILRRKQLDISERMATLAEEKEDIETESLTCYELLTKNPRSPKHHIQRGRKKVDGKIKWVICPYLVRDRYCGQLEKLPDFNEFECPYFKAGT